MNIIFRKPTFNELRFEWTTSQLKEYAKRIGMQINVEKKKLVLAREIAKFIGVKEK